MAAAEDGSVFVAFAKTGRIEKYSSDGTWITSWTAADNLAGGQHPIAGFTVAGQFVFTLTVSPPQIRVWTLDGQHRLDADLAGRLGGIAAPQIAVTPHAELLVFDPSAPRVCSGSACIWKPRSKNDSAAHGSRRSFPAYHADRA